jgi:hypothetical protein
MLGWYEKYIQNFNRPDRERSPANLRHGQNDNINMDLKAIKFGNVDCICLKKYAVLWVCKGSCAHRQNSRVSSSETSGVVFQATRCDISIYIRVGYNKVEWLAALKTIMNIQDEKRAGTFLPTCLSRSTIHHVLNYAISYEETPRKQFSGRWYNCGNSSPFFSLLRRWKL